MVRRHVWLASACAVLALNSVYLWARNDPTALYVANVLLHLGLSGVALVLGLPPLARLLRGPGVLRRATGVLLAVGVISGVAIVVLGATKPHRWIVWAHAGSLAAGALLLPLVVSSEWRRRVAMAVGVVAVLALVLRALPTSVSKPANNSGALYGSELVRNPQLPPESMSGENAAGTESPFFPSSVETSDGKFIPSSFFLESEQCGASSCHPDITAQWRESAHRLSSFNNQWYRRSITYMQEVQGIEGSKWCAGCHDPAVLLTGRWTRPIVEQLDTPEAHAGLGCSACHSIAHVKNTMGNGGMVYEYPTMHRFAETSNPLLKALHDFVVHLDPAPHRETFLKDFHTEQTSEFCSGCHKVHLDEPVNHFRWVRGFNEYDAWQSSGVSGQGAMSFYYPPTPKGCGDCHMPLVPSKDKGNIQGMVHSHRFPAANTALPYAWDLPDQLKATEEFLKSKIVTLDIFGMVIGADEQAVDGSTAGSGPMAFTLSGDESGLIHGASGGSTVDVSQIIAPLGAVDAAIRRGDSARMSVVVRTRGVGHRFPGGTFDAFDVWVELEAKDNRGRTVFHSGGIEPDGSVDRGAHFYRSVMLDARGNVINKRNAWAARTVLYARGIPPGAADTVHFRLDIPPDAGDTIALTARLHYRKFDRYNTNFAYAGVSNGDGSYDLHHDDRTWSFTGDTSGVAGVVKSIPNLPVITVAEDTKTIRVLPADAPAVAPRTATSKELRERWNDYGIGLFLQGDLKNARTVFELVTRMDPEYADGWVNVARAEVREGDLDAAERNLREAIRLLDATPSTNPHRAKAHVLMGQAHRTRGEFREALAEFGIAAKQYPRDKTILNELGKVHFLMRDFEKAAEYYGRTLQVDPEDLTAHYNLMLTYRGMGDSSRAAEHQARYVRFKADEAAQAITGDVRRHSPELNLERQAIREHYTMTVRASSPVGFGGTQATARMNR
ncbi:tetratricopeptide repeat protein [Candidatus Poribacteria bacterium]|nr:tetratricopeptide repeat protein [Candidatus Poribacteria bacterium]